MGEFIKKYKLYIILGISTLILLIGTTIAWYVWESTNNDEINLEVCTPTITFVGGSTINGTDMIPVSDKENGIKKEIEVAINNNCNTNVTMYLDLELTTLPTALADETFVYELYRGSTQVKTGNFENKVQGNTISLLSETTITDGDTFTLYIYIDGTKDNSSEMANKSFTFNLFGYGKGAIFKRTLVQTITNLYINATKSTVTNNGITYNYATSVSLMNDRLGSSTTDINGGNIRYYGANPNNYVYFNCSDYSNQSDTTCEKWRIIGVFDGKVKIIRNESIGAYSWDNKDTTTGIESNSGKNDWTTARLMKLLNPSNYYTIDEYDNGNGQSLYYNGQSGTCFAGSKNATTSCDFTSTGLKTGITRNMISEEVWYLEYGYWDFALANDLYVLERSRNIQWNGKVGLLYLSDLAYSQSFVNCNFPLEYFNLDSESCSASNNWLINDKNRTIWLITSGSGYPTYSYVFVAGKSSNNLLSFTGSASDASYTNEVFPTLYLNSNIELASDTGNGTEDNPYRLSV